MCALRLSGWVGERGGVGCRQGPARPTPASPHPHTPLTHTRAHAPPTQHLGRPTIALSGWAGASEERFCESYARTSQPSYRAFAERWLASPGAPPPPAAAACAAACCWAACAPERVSSAGTLLPLVLLLGCVCVVPARPKCTRCPLKPSPLNPPCALLAEGARWIGMARDAEDARPAQGWREVGEEAVAAAAAAEEGEETVATGGALAAPA